MIIMPSLTDLADQWREEAEELEKLDTQVSAAALLRRNAAELEATLTTRATETLNLQEAAEESGYSADHLGRLIRKGEIPNAGENGAPRIRRVDLPRKPGHRRNGSEPGAAVGSRMQVARSVVESD